MMIGTPFPGIGKTYETDFGEWCCHLHFQSATQMQITSITSGNRETVPILIVPLRPGLFLVHWQEEDSAVISQLQDYENDTVFTVTTFHRAILLRWGKFREVQEER